ncbi:MAG TPA: urease subunit alpha [Candidatus Limnocylindrales bacterium]|nr:urease subunit alpha [Candidatus Limnocylindrales bacterium]
MSGGLHPAERLARYGPTAGDRLRLADTDLWVRVTEDRQASGDEPIWGYAKTLRPRMTQTSRASDSELDTVVAGALVIDPTIGIVKADIGIKDGRIVGVGRAGNPAISDGIELEIGPHTAPIMAYGLIATPGAVDSHVHLVSPTLMPAALSGGVTTLITAGFEEPPWAMERTLGAMTEWPLNIGIQACARSEVPADFEALLDAGAVGFKIHEDYGADPALIDATLRFAEAAGVVVSLHTDGLHETAELEDTIAAIGGRTVHAYHVEGTGGGHVPDLLALVREPNIICSSTTPTIPFGVSAAAEHVAMIVLNHGGSMAVAADVALAADRIHPATMAAEGPLHDLGAIQIINSDSQGMGRIMETVRRSLQLASVLTRWRGSTLKRAMDVDGADGPDDNERVLRYLAKVTIEPAITHGLADHVGSLRSGRLADIVLWKPAWFGAKPELVLKSGVAAWAPLGEGNATVERAEPTRYRGDWGAGAGLASRLGVTFASAATADAVRRRSVGGREIVPIGRTRGLTRTDLWLNRSTASIEIDRTDGRVTLDGQRLAIEPVDELPLSRRYFLR